MPGKYYADKNNVEKDKYSFSKERNEYNDIMKELSAVHKKLNSPEFSAYEKLEMPTYKQPDTLKEWKALIHEMAILLEDRKQRLAFRLQDTRGNFIKEIIFECPEEKSVEIIDMHKYNLFDIPRKRRYNFDKEHGRIAYLLWQGKVMAIRAKPEQLSKMLQDPRIEWGFNINTTKYFYN